MLVVKVKICGVTNYEDATASVDMGADLVGINFYPKSPRYVSPEKATKIINVRANPGDDRPMPNKLDSIAR